MARKAKVESWADGYERRNRERQAEKRQVWTDRVMRLVDALRVLKVEDGVPAVEVARALGDDSYGAISRVGVSLRRLLEMGMVEREKRTYESVVRWSMTEHGLALLDRLADNESSRDGGS